MDFYYYYRAIIYFISKFKISQENALTIKDFGKNTDFSNRKYYLTQLNKIFRKNGLFNAATLAVGFGSVTLWRKEIFSVAHSILFSNFIENVSNKFKLSVLKFFANRWVFYLKKGDEVEK